MEAHALVSVKPNPRIEDFGPGDTVRVSFRIREGERERVQAFQGVVIRRRGGGPGATFTVRRVSHSIGIERTYPVYSPLLESVEVVRGGIVRRAKLYYLRGRSGRAARIKERRMVVGKAAAAIKGTEVLQELEDALQTEESLQPEDLVQPEDSQEPEDSLQTEDSPQPEDSAQTADVEQPEDSVQTEDVERPEDSVQTENVERPEDSVQTEDVEQPEDLQDSEDTQEPLASQPIEESQQPDGSQRRQDSE